MVAMFELTVVYTSITEVPIKLYDASFGTRAKKQNCYSIFKDIS